LLAIADGCKGYACIMPMRRTPEGWAAALPGWGLVRANASVSIDPPALVTEEVVEMTNWGIRGN
jgi:hypothetical protein